MSKYQELIVWQKAMDLVEEVYNVVSKLPSQEKYALSDQLRRAVVSIPSNIAEGQNRGSRKEVVQFCGIALGSLAEVETQLILVHRLYGVKVNSCLQHTKEIALMLISLIKKLRVGS